MIIGMAGAPNLVLSSLGLASTILLFGERGLNMTASIGYEDWRETRAATLLITVAL